MDVLLLYLAGAILLITGAVQLTAMAFTDGEIKYCYVESSNDAYLLKGSRDWRDDTTVGTFKSLDEVAEAAKKIECPLNKKK